MFKLHTVDVYLWTAEDASLLLDSLKRVLVEGQLRLHDVPPGLAEHRNSMSPVVQQLEQAAISPQNKYGRSASISTTHTSHSQAVNAMPAASRAAETPVQGGAQQQPYTAIAAYNPAAPAAPEPIAHREKTPPPLDADAGNGLLAAQRHETVPQFAGPPQQQAFGPQAGQPFFAGPPTAAAPGAQPGLQRTATGPYGGPSPPQQQQPYAPAFAGPPTQDPNAHLYAQQPHPGVTRAATFAGYPTYPLQQGTSPPAAGAVPSQSPQHSPHLYQQSHSVPLGSPPLPAGQPPAYQSQHYAYGHHDSNNINHSIHQMAYIPEQGKGAGMPAQAGPGQAAATGWLENRINKTTKAETQYGKVAGKAEAQIEGKTSKFEKRFNKLLKKLDDGV